jgi:arylsulfatase A-like enzyme
MLFGPECAFDDNHHDNDHEWYDHDADPGELVNLANDRALRADLRAEYEGLLAYEAESLVATEPQGA